MKKVLSMFLIVALVCSLSIVVLSGCKDKYDFKVGVLHINPTSSTSGYTYAHEQGILAMQKALNLNDKQIVRKDNVDDTDSNVITAAIEDLISSGCNFIIGTSYGYQEEMLNLAPLYPNVIFSHGTGFLNAGNMNNYFGRIYQARYLSGIVAGLKASAGGKIGYVTAFGLSVPETASGINAFALGVQSVNPTATVLVKELKSWFDPVNEGAYAKTLIDLGCEVIAQHSDTENPSKEAQIAGKFSIGYNSDMSLSSGKSVLTSVVWNWGVYYKLAGAKAQELILAERYGDWSKEMGDYYGSIADDLFGLTALSTEVATGTAEKVKAVTELMKKGVAEWDVFSGVKLSFDENNNVVKTNANLLRADDTLVVEAGKGSVEDGIIKGVMDYWVKGVKQV